MRTWTPGPLSVATFSLLLLASTARPAQACDRSTLESFAPATGEILMSKRLPGTEQVVRQVEVSSELAECEAEEPDPDCRDRLTVERDSLADAGQRVTVELEGPTLGVYAKMMGTEGGVDGLFGSYEELANFMESTEATQQELTLQFAEPALDRAQRKAVVRVVEERSEPRSLPPGLRVVYRPEGSSLEALDSVQDAARPQGITVVSWLPRDGGTVILDLRCLPD
jgi:hypothetical protein